MPNNLPKGVRVAGKLHLGSVVHNKAKGVLSVEMAFESNTSIIGEDEEKSCAIASTRHFYNIMRQHGFYQRGEPVVRIVEREGKFMRFYIACAVSKVRGELISIESKKQKLEDEKERSKDHAAAKPKPDAAPADAKTEDGGTEPRTGGEAGPDDRSGGEDQCRRPKRKNGNGSPSR